jgi:hypothetical protein
MRASDKAKSGIDFYDAGNNSFDKQISSDQHDKICLWLYKKLKTDKAFFMSAMDFVPDIVFEKVDFRLESPILRGDRIIGFCDVEVRLWFKDDRDNLYSRSFLIEVKSKVNVGETIRQIRYYGGEHWYVCAPMFDDVDVLKEQGIRFIPYEP